MSTVPAHITAQNLAELFQGKCPATPNLCEAYVKRVGLIAQRAYYQLSEYQRSAFSSWAKGTSEQDEATSEKSTLHIQLLTCMLARAYDGPEATSTWMELVEERTKQVVDNLPQDEVQNYIAFVRTTAADSMSRSRLEELDASARAWLWAADKTKDQHEKQLLRLLHYTIWDTSGNHDISFYDRVMEAWKIAITVLENLIAGTPQDPHHNVILVGIGASHLYPDIILQGSPIEEIEWGDYFVDSRGILSIVPQLPEATKASALDTNQKRIHRRLPLEMVIRRTHKFTRSFSRSSSEEDFLSSVLSRSLFAFLLGCGGEFSRRPFKSSYSWDAWLLRSRDSIPAPTLTRTPSGRVQSVPSTETADDQAHSTVRIGSPHSTTESQTLLLLTTFSVRQIFLRHITILGAMLILHSSLATALILIYAGGLSVSDAFTAAAWVFPAGAILLYVIKSCLGGEVEERISPFS